MRRGVRRLGAALASVAGALAAGPALGQATLEVIALPPGFALPDPRAAQPTERVLKGISGNGRVIAMTRKGAEFFGTELEAQLWVAGQGWRTPSRFPQSDLIALSGDAGAAVDDRRWYSGLRIAKLPSRIVPVAMDAGGTVVVAGRGSTFSGVWGTVRLTLGPSGVTTTELPLDSVVRPRCISPDGLAIGGQSTILSVPNAAYLQPGLWIEGVGDVALPIFTEEASVWSVSNQGRFAVGYNFNSYRGWLWNRGAANVSYFRSISGDDRMIPLAIDAEGDRVVGYSRPVPLDPVGVDGWIWDRTRGARRLSDELRRLGVSLPAGTKLVVQHMSSDGRVVVGWYGDRLFRATLPAYCYADCNQDGRVDAADIACWQARFVARDWYTDCTRDTAAPFFTAADFTCFMDKYTRGCTP